MSSTLARIDRRRLVAAFVIVAVALAGAMTRVARAQQAAQKNDGRLYVVTFVDFIPANAEVGRKLVQQYVADTRKDPGVVRIEAVTQDSRENHLVIFEVWQDQKAFDAHTSADHTRDFRNKATPWMGAWFDQRIHHLLP